MNKDRYDVEGEIPYVNTDRDRIVISYKQRELEGFIVEPHLVRIRDARATDEALSVERQGFQIVKWPSKVVQERLPELIEENRLPSEVMGPANLAYLAEMEPLMHEICGAREVFAQYGTVTVRFSKRAAARSWMTTAQFAHLDFAKTDIDRLLQETLELTGRKVAPFSRHVMMQAWRVLTPPPQDMPLAICDGRSVYKEDMVPLEFLGPEGSRNELVHSRGCLFSPRHEWYYFPNMTPDEVMIFKGFDSDCPDAMNAMHTAFDNTSVVDTVPRGSVECRFIALYD
ncbi:hypothetical protein NTD80_20805 [Pseudomonas sp. 13B_2.1_Bac1]|uniref:CmcJ/NvfI family oxidoreductase n=1 Tax=Pseudomonas sp. 13B_2.1_Bac1 TaxID=2971624 RepID=UPI0021C7365B|nr:CmcJ/NvfI family oxidoreductase [Pseudomonas sp. 13B_2.1_Bac1]MCU1785188.1 hypothetical protein [Pseudomonas sp. 13B_2.1_Bac1]